MLSGEPAFSGDSLPSLLYNVVHQMPRPLSEIRPDIPPEIAVVVERAMAKIPGDRFASMLEFSEALDDAARGFKEMPGSRPLPAGLAAISEDTMQDSSEVALAHTLPSQPVTPLDVNRVRKKHHSTFSSSSAEIMTGSRRNRRQLLGGAVLASVLLVTGGVFYFSWSSSSQDRVPVAPTAVAPAPASSAVERTSPAAPKEVPPPPRLAAPPPATVGSKDPRQVRIKIIGDPAGAAVYSASTGRFLVKVPGMFQLPRDIDTPVSLRIEAKDHLPATLNVLPDRHQVRTINLAKATRARPRRGRRKQSSRKHSPKTRPPGPAKKSAKQPKSFDPEHITNPFE